MSETVKDVDVKDAIAQATAQPDPKETRKEVMDLIEESRKGLRNVDFTYSQKYQDLRAQLDTAEEWQKEKIIAQMTDIKINGTISPSERQEILDSAIALPLDRLMSERDRLTMKYNDL